MACSIGLDYGTNSVRCLIVNTDDGNELGTAICEYETGENGVVLDPSDHNLARQNPADYIKGLQVTIKKAVAYAKKADSNFNPRDIIGIGIDTTGSTPLPVDKNGTPLSELKDFKKNPNAYAWLWKDHTGYAEAAEITQLARKEHPEYLAKCGGIYSSEWFFSKILHCLRTDPKVFDAAYTWVECADYIPAVLTDTCAPDKLKVGRCAAGHKAMFNDNWGGLPAKDFLTKLDPKLGELRNRLYDRTYTVDVPAGGLTGKWARKLGLKSNIPVVVGAFDAHLGAIGRPGRSHTADSGSPVLTTASPRPCETLSSTAVHVYCGFVSTSISRYDALSALRAIGLSTTSKALSAKYVSAFAPVGRSTRSR